MEVIEPVSYLDMIALLRDASIVITDSGGLQKKHSSFKSHVSSCDHKPNGQNWLKWQCHRLRYDAIRISASMHQFIAKSNLTSQNFTANGQC